MFYDSRKFYFFSDFGLTFHRAASINHVVDFSTIFAPLPLVDRHGFLANPLENHVEFWRTPPPSCDSNFFDFLANFSAILCHVVIAHFL